MKQTNKIMFNAKIVPVKPLNEEFTLCKCYVLALGKNRNRSYIGEKAVEKALPTIYNIPVIGHMYTDEDGNYHMGGHDMVLSRDENNKLMFKSICIPVGTVPSQDNIHYEEVSDSKGNKSVYQVADVILWTGRYPDLYKAIYSDEVFFGQSMEINVKSSNPLEEDKTYEEITEFAYSALCLLGKSDDKEYHVEPCFPEARVEPYQFSIDTNEFVGLMDEFRSKLADCFQAINTNKGGETKLTIEVLNSVLEEYSLAKEDLNFEVTEEMTEEEFRTNLDKFVEESKTDEPATETEPVTESEPEATESTDTFEEEPADKEPEDEESKEEEPKEAESEDKEPEEVEETDEPAEDTENEEVKEDYSLNPSTYGEKAKALCLAVAKLDVSSVEGCVFHYMSDFDDKYVYIARCICLENDYSEENVKTSYEFVNGEVVFGETFEPVVQRWLTEEEVAELENKDKEYQELKDFYTTRIEEDRMKEYDAVLSDFSDLVGNEEFSKVLENKQGFENAEALKERCYAIRGKSVVVSTAKKTEAKARIGNYSSDENLAYGGLFVKFPPRGRK